MLVSFGSDVTGVTGIYPRRSRKLLLGPGRLVPNPG
jgi:hypothetical protein